MPAACTASGSPAFGPKGSPAVRDQIQSAAKPAFAMTPAVRSSAGGRVQASNAQINWNTAIEAKKIPEGSQTLQCAGVTAKWITAAPNEAVAAARAATLLSVPETALEIIAPMVPTGGEATQAPAHNGRVSDSLSAVISAAVRIRTGGFFIESLSNPDRWHTPAGDAGGEMALLQAKETICRRIASSCGYLKRTVGG